MPPETEFHQTTRHGDIDDSRCSLGLSLAYDPSERRVAVESRPSWF